MTDKLRLTLDADALSTKVEEKIRQITDPVQKENALLRAQLKASEDMRQFFVDRVKAQDRQIAAHKSTILAQERAIERLEFEAHAQQSKIDELYRANNDLRSQEIRSKLNQVTLDDLLEEVTSRVRNLRGISAFPDSRV